MNTPSSVHPDNRSSVEIQWTGGMQFDAGKPGVPTVHIDGDGQNGPGPFDVLLSAIAACASTDVVSILEKQRTPARSLRVTVDAVRAAETPRRLVSANLQFTIEAPGTTLAHAQRAVDLSITKYCSVRASLSESAPITWSVQVV